MARVKYLPTPSMRVRREQLRGATQHGDIAEWRSGADFVLTAIAANYSARQLRAGPCHIRNT